MNLKLQIQMLRNNGQCLRWPSTFQKRCIWRVSSKSKYSPLLSSFHFRLKITGSCRLYICRLISLSIYIGIISLIYLSILIRKAISQQKCRQHRYFIGVLGCKNLLLAYLEDLCVQCTVLLQGLPATWQPGSGAYFIRWAVYSALYGSHTAIGCLRLRYEIK